MVNKFSSNLKNFKSHEKSRIQSTFVSFSIEKMISLDRPTDFIIHFFNLLSESSL